MRFKDKVGSEYRAIKKNGKYFLITSVYDKYKQREIRKIEVEGKENIFTFIRNNQLEAIK